LEFADHAVVVAEPANDLRNAGLSQKNYSGKLPVGNRQPIVNCDR
jgi:hypothetical protein